MPNQETNLYTHYMRKVMLPSAYCCENDLNLLMKVIRRSSGFYSRRYSEPRRFVIDELT